MENIIKAGTKVKYRGCFGIIKTSCFLRKIFEKFQKLFKISLYLYMYQVSYG